MMILDEEKNSRLQNDEEKARRAQQDVETRIMALNFDEDQFDKRNCVYYPRRLPHSMSMYNDFDRISQRVQHDSDVIIHHPSRCLAQLTAQSEEVGRTTADFVALSTDDEDLAHSTVNAAYGQLVYVAPDVGRMRRRCDLSVDEDADSKTTGTTTKITEMPPRIKPNPRIEELKHIKWTTSNVNRYVDHDFPTLSDPPTDQNQLKMTHDQNLIDNFPPSSDVMRHTDPSSRFPIVVDDQDQLNTTCDQNLVRVFSSLNTTSDYNSSSAPRRIGDRAVHADIKSNIFLQTPKPLNTGASINNNISYEESGACPKTCKYVNHFFGQRTKDNVGNDLLSDSSESVDLNVPLSSFR
uniref:Uncharacterized protein n=1 Tax=Romanomermis culicivorax TaxID=13658 RepID=A0A915L2U7_ROMCU